jgi:hypothetical protein
MPEADSVHSTPPINTSVTRRNILGTAAGAAAALVATGASPMAASPAPDPIFALIEAHRTATALHSAALKEQERLEQIGDPRASEVSDAPCNADAGAWRELVNTAPQTFAGLQAWAFYLDEVRGKEEWMLEEETPAIVMTLARSLERLAVQS